MDDKLATGQRLNNAKTTNTTRPQAILLNVQSRSFVRPCRHYKDDYGNVECHFICHTMTVSVCNEPDVKCR